MTMGGAAAPAAAAPAPPRKTSGRSTAASPAPPTSPSPDPFGAAAGGGTGRTSRTSSPLRPGAVWENLVQGTAVEMSGRLDGPGPGPSPIPRGTSSSAAQRFGYNTGPITAAAGETYDYDAERATTGRTPHASVSAGRHGSVEYNVHLGRGLHSSTLKLNLSAFCVTGGAVRGCFEGV
jgi:hypothetical protein